MRLLHHWMKTYSILWMLYCINGEWSGVSIIFRSYPTSIWMRHWQCLHQNKQFLWWFSHLLYYTLLSAELEVTMSLQKLIKICCISIGFDPMLYSHVWPYFYLKDIVFHPKIITLFYWAHLAPDSLLHHNNANIRCCIANLQWYNSTITKLQISHKPE